MQAQDGQNEGRERLLFSFFLEHQRRGTGEEKKSRRGQGRVQEVIKEVPSRQMENAMWRLSQADGTCCHWWLQVESWPDPKFEPTPAPFFPLRFFGRTLQPRILTTHRPLLPVLDQLHVATSTWKLKEGLGQDIVQLLQSWLTLTLCQVMKPTLYIPHPLKSCELHRTPRLSLPFCHLSTSSPQKNNIPRGQSVIL